MPLLNPPSPASSGAAGTGSSDIPQAYSADLGQQSLSTKQLISQTPAIQRLELGLVKTSRYLCSLWPTEQKGLRAGQETTGENTFSADGTGLSVTRMQEAGAGMLCGVQAGEPRPVGRVAIQSISNASGPIYQVLGLLSD